MKIKFIFILFLIVIVFSTSINNLSAEESAKEVILATTTSVYDTGLLDLLIEKFYSETGYSVTPLAVGTGEALKLAEKGEVDLVLVHNEKAEKKFIKEGYGLNRKEIMHNFFIIIGPENDPAQIKSCKNATEAFKKIYESKCAFVSRGDMSGTNKKEMDIWDKLSLKPDGKFYLQTGQGMAATLRIANEKDGYTLTDKSSYIFLKDQMELVILLEDNIDLINRYSVIQVNPESFPFINNEGAKLFSDFLISEEVQKIIKDFGENEFGKALFIPDRLNFEVE